MVKLFLRCRSGRWYQLAVDGWAMRDGMVFTSVAQARWFAATWFMPVMPDGEVGEKMLVGMLDRLGSVVALVSVHNEKVGL